MPTDPDVVVGDGLRLVPVRAEDVPDVLRGVVTGARPGRGWPHAATAAALSFVAGGGRTWLIVDATDAVVGEAGTKSPPTEDGVVEIGYGLAGPHRGHGLGTRAVAALVRHLDREPGVAAILAHVATDNEPSWRLLERLGFVDEPGSGPDGERRYLLRTPIDDDLTDLRW
jgi:RimJ/RimL family protein N-acetyltransferase